MVKSTIWFAVEGFDKERFKAALADVEGVEIVSAEPTIEDMFIKLMRR